MPASGEHSDFDSYFISPNPLLVEHGPHAERRSATSLSPSLPYSTLVRLCMVGFFTNCQPSEPYLTRYLIEEKGLSEGQLDDLVWPVDTYAALAFLIPLGMLAEAKGYRPVIFLGLLCRQATRLLLLFGQGVFQMQLMQACYAAASGAQTVYLAYPYLTVDVAHFAAATAAVRGSVHLGNAFGSLIGQGVVSYTGWPLRSLFFLSWAFTSAGLAFFPLLPPPLPPPTREEGGWEHEDEAGPRAQNRTQMLAPVARLKPFAVLAELLQVYRHSSATASTCTKDSGGDDTCCLSDSASKATTTFYGALRERMATMTAARTATMSATGAGGGARHDLSNRSSTAPTGNGNGSNVNGRNGNGSGGVARGSGPQSGVHGGGDGEGEGGQETTEGWWGSSVLSLWSVWWVLGTACAQLFLNYYQNMIYAADPKALFGLVEVGMEVAAAAAAALPLLLVRLLQQEKGAALAGGNDGSRGGESTGAPGARQQQQGGGAGEGGSGGQGLACLTAHHTSVLLGTSGLWAATALVTCFGFASHNSSGSWPPPAGVACAASVLLSALLTLQQAVASLLIATGADAGTKAAAASAARRGQNGDNLALAEATHTNTHQPSPFSIGSPSPEDLSLAVASESPLFAGLALESPPSSAPPSPSSSAAEEEAGTLPPPGTAQPPLYAAVFTALSMAGLVLSSLVQWSAALAGLKTKGFIVAAAAQQAAAVPLVLALLACGLRGKK